MILFAWLIGNNHLSQTLLPFSRFPSVKIRFDPDAVNQNRMTLQPFVDRFFLCLIKFPWIVKGKNLFLVLFLCSLFFYWYFWIRRRDFRTIWKLFLFLPAMDAKIIIYRNLFLTIWSDFVLLFSTFKAKFAILWKVFPTFVTIHFFPP